MSKVSDSVLKKALELSYEERVHLADQLAENLALETPLTVIKSQIEVIRGRLSDVLIDKIDTIPGVVGLKMVRDQFGK